MNKFSSLVTFCILGLLGCLTGCGNDPEPRTGLLFASGNNLLTQNQAVTGGQVYAASLYAQTGEENPFTRFRIIRTYDGTDSITYLDSTLNTTEFGLYFNFGTRSFAGQETWRFVITDQNNTEYSRRFTLTTSTGNTAAKPFNTYSSYFYKNSALDNLQYFSLRDGTVYPGFIGRNNAAVKDFVDFYFDQDAAKVISVNPVASANTQFKPSSLTPAAYNEIVTLDALQTAYTTNSNAPVSVIQNLIKNQVIAFNTNSRSGLIRINSINRVFDAAKQDSVLIRMTYDIKATK